ncbi:MAG: hypothetical protein Q8M99_09840 [Methylotenera sp.]|nr:hypothetical protein [Methylotenera sp.]
MYKESGGEFVSPDKVASPASGATVLMGLALKSVAALISMIFLILSYLL